MRGCFDTPSIAFLYTICNSSFLPFSENLCKENLPALDKGLLIIFTDKNSPRRKTHHQPAESSECTGTVQPTAC